MSIKAVVFDLDDTLYPEIDYVKSGFHAAGREIEKIYGLKLAEYELLTLFYSGKLGVFDRYLKNHNIQRTEQSVGELCLVYRTHKPNIKLENNVEQMLGMLRKKGYKLGIITDGRPSQQRKKIATLGLERFIDEIIVTDELGGIECRKPNPLAFELLCQKFGIIPEEMLYVGDNPEKDFAVKRKLPIITVRFLTAKGLYAQCDYKYDIAPDYTIENIEQLTTLLEEKVV